MANVNVIFLGGKSSIVCCGLGLPFRLAVEKRNSQPDPDPFASTQPARHTSLRSLLRERGVGAIEPPKAELNKHFALLFGNKHAKYSCLSLRTGIVEFFLQISFALFFLLQNFIDSLLQLLAIIANCTSRSKNLGLTATVRRLVDCRLLRSLRLLPITTN
jgi:hypothetical protein